MQQLQIGQTFAYPHEIEGCKEDLLVHVPIAHIFMVLYKDP